jgi:hypothetical protein
MEGRTTQPTEKIQDYTMDLCSPLTRGRARRCQTLWVLVGEQSRLSGPKECAHVLSSAGDSAAFQDGIG